MDNPLIRKAADKRKLVENKYKHFGLTENPFPLQPGLSPGGSNPRTNGSIYSSELTSDKEGDLRRLLIPSPKNREPLSIAFLMDYATRSGRGIGKSAFLYNQCSKISKDFGAEASGGEEVLFAVCIRPVPNNRKFWEICRLIGETFVENNIIEKAIWRLRAASGLIPDVVMNEILKSDDWESTIGSDSWLSERNVNTAFILNRHVMRMLIDADVPEPLAKDLAFLGGNSGNQQKIFGNYSDSTWRRLGGAIIFDHLVKFFIAAGFTRGLLLMDELERIVYYQNTEERRNFAESLRHYFFDANIENAKTSFYGMLLTIHPLIQELLIPHWKATGLDRFSPLSQPKANESTIYFRSLSKPMAKPLVIAYLNAFRQDESQKNTISPFTENSISEVLVKSRGVPGLMLRLLHHVIEQAVDSDILEIDSDFIDTVDNTQEHLEEKEIPMEELPPQTRTDLTGNDL